MDFEVYDGFEALVLDFLAYRRNRKTAAPPQVTVKPPQVVREDVPSIGKGWPHYKAAVATAPVQGNAEPLSMDGPANEIIRELLPVVRGMTAHFGRPQTPSDMAHLTHQVLAEAMANPVVGESMHAGEVRPWGRVPLLQTVVELLLRYS
jgi:hypothetical protein